MSQILLLADPYFFHVDLGEYFPQNDNENNARKKRFCYTNKVTC